MKEVGSGSELGSESVEKEPEAEAIFLNQALPDSQPGYNHRIDNQGMVWKMEWNGNFGMKYGRCQNGIEWKISRMKWKNYLPYFHINFMLDFVHCIYRKIHTDVG